LEKGRKFGGGNYTLGLGFSTSKRGKPIGTHFYQRVVELEPNLNNPQKGRNTTNLTETLDWIFTTGQTSETTVPFWEGPVPETFWQQTDSDLDPGNFQGLPPFKHSKPSGYRGFVPTQRCPNFEVQPLEGPFIGAKLISKTPSGTQDFGPFLGI